MSDLSAEELRLIRDKGRDGQLFRAGARAEAECRNVGHHEMLSYLRALCEAHPDWTDERILQAGLRVFADGAHALSEAARIELEATDRQEQP